MTPFFTQIPSGFDGASNPTSPNPEGEPSVPYGAGDQNPPPESEQSENGSPTAEPSVVPPAEEQSQPTEQPPVSQEPANEQIAGQSSEETVSQ